MEWLYKNLDDILAVAPDFKTIKDRIIQILNVCRKRNIKLSPSKFQLGKSVTFGGVSVSHSSLLDTVCLDVTSDKIAEIEALRMPGTRREAQSFVGMICQLNQFIPNISHKLKHMRKLTSTSHISYRPPPEAIMEFNSLKQEMKERVTLSPIDVNLPLHLYTDASTDGLSYFLTQEKEWTDEKGGKILDESGKQKVTKRIIHIGSTSLTAAQSRYSPMELELLCVQWST